YPCEPPRVIVIPQQRLSIFCRSAFSRAHYQRSNYNAFGTASHRGAFVLRTTPETDNYAAHDGFFSPVRGYCRCAHHAVALHILRKASNRPNAGGPTRTAGSSHTSLGSGKRRKQAGIVTETGGG